MVVIFFNNNQINFSCSDFLDVIDFKDVLFSCLKHAYGIESYKNASKETKNYMLQIEKNTKEKIDANIKVQSLSPLKRFSFSMRSKQNVRKDHLKKNFFISLTGMLYLKISFRAWLKYTTNGSLGTAEEIKTKKKYGKIRLKLI